MRRLAALLLAGLLGFAPALAAPKRIVSINMCTDQLLLDLAQPERILGLSPYARDRARAFAADKAEAYPLLSGTAEEILVLKPDLVLAGSFTGRTTREFIRARAIPVAEFDAALSIEETKRQITRMGAILGEETRALARVEAIDAALARLRAAASQRRLRILPVARRGWVWGGASLTNDLLKVAGLANAADELGVGEGGFASLEAIVKLKPDAILLTRDDISGEDQGTAKLMHPALAGHFPPSRRLVMPEKLTVCGGAMLAEAADQLAREIGKLADEQAVSAPPRP